jgi:S1-C subfamily serine protease
MSGAGLVRLAGFLIAGALAALPTSVCGTLGTDNGALKDFPGTTRQQLIQERDEPAVVLIDTSYSATFSVPGINGDTPAIKAMQAAVNQQAIAGQIPADTKSLNDTKVQILLSNPDGYFAVEDPATPAKAAADFRCTGSIITPDGYIVTAAHCISSPADTRYQAYLQGGLQQALDDTGRGVVGTGWDSDQAKVLAQAGSRFLALHAQMTAETTTITVHLFSSGASGQRQELESPATVVAQGNAPPKSTGPFGDRDVAILKIDGFQNLPTLPLGSDTDVEAGQQLYVDGYPGAAENGNIANLSTPSITAGSISARKVSDLGVPLLETTATVSPGNSGGPGLSADNRIVGIVSYGSTTAGAAYNYLIGASVVAEYLRQKHVVPRESTTTHVFDVALDDYHRQYYKRALAGFEQVAKLDPTHPTVEDFIHRSEDALQQGQDRTPVLDGTALVAVAAGAAVLLAAMLGAAALAVALIVRQRRRA